MAAIREAVTADVERYVSQAAGAWGLPGQALALVEAAARDTANRIGLAMIQLTLQAGGEPAGIGRPGCAQGHLARQVGTRPRTIRTALGPASYARTWWHCGTCHTGWAPADQWWGLDRVGHTTGYDKILTLAGVDHPYRASAALIGELCGIDLASPASIARTTRRVGAAAQARCEAETAAINNGTLSYAWAEPAPEVGYILIDGTGAPMVPAETAGRPGKGPDGRSRTREVKIGCLFTQATATPDGKPVRDEQSASYLATFEAADGFADQLRDEHRRRGFSRIRQPIVIGDGAKWIWKIAERLFPEATHIVDYWHACEHIHDLVKIVDHLLPDPTTFTHQLIDQLDHGNINQIVTTITDLNLNNYQGTLAERTSKALDYFTGNAHRMQYHHYRTNGWFIGSGPVEAACKTLVTQRAKQAGMRWTITGLDPILTLRALTRSHRDHTIWGSGTTPTAPTRAA
ncbi:MAG: ISKra4 family transposase [Micropruina sp.]|uniref:ISKra4 family transposase n=1 Tax=Micropruina sp. TaxID=2737536 RepID=UPI0039E627F6